MSYASSYPAAVLPAALALLCACGSSTPPSETPSTTDVPDVSATELDKHLRFLASDALAGRMTGTPGYDAAAEYVASQFHGLGLEPAGDDDYFQHVPYVSSHIDTESAAVRVFGGEDAKELEFRDDFVMGGDVSREHAKVRAPAVFVGHGVSAPDLDHDDYADVDVDGKIVVAVSGAPEALPVNERAYHSSGLRKQETAAERGAVGYVSLRDAYAAEHYEWDATAHNAGTLPTMRWLSDDEEPADHVPELRGVARLSESAAAELFIGASQSHDEIMAADADGKALDSFPLEVELELERESSIEHITGPNVVGVLPGADPELADEYVVYSAHLDHLGEGRPVDGDAIYNGAYDNALGVSVLIETARAFSELDTPPRRSILFIAVGAEELGLRGSDYFARNQTVTGDLVANVNLDMPLFLYPLRDVVAFGAEHSTLESPVERAAEAEGWELSPDPMPEEVIFIRSDQYSFVRRGVPAVFLVSGMSSTDPDTDGGAAQRDFLQNHYHKPSDDLSQPIHWPSAQTFTRVNMRIGLEVANADAAPEWHSGNFFGERFGEP